MTRQQVPSQRTARKHNNTNLQLSPGCESHEQVGDHDVQQRLKSDCAWGVSTGAEVALQLLIERQSKIVCQQEQHAGQQMAGKVDDERGFLLLPDAIDAD